MVRLVVGVCVGLLVLFVTTVATAPQQQTTSGTAELMIEVRLLRQAIENLAGNGTRVQIAFGRLQLQEQRTTAAARRVDDLRNTSARLSREVAEMTARLKELDAMANDARRTDEEQEEFRVGLRHTKRTLELLEAERVRQIALETEASNALAEEQSRWADVNRQLEELERALAPRRP